MNPQVSGAINARRMMPTTPTTMPTIAISRVGVVPVEYAIAFGGVEIGRHMPSEQPRAMTMAISAALVDTVARQAPYPSGSRGSPTPNAK
mgnify:CR=1 FL=1